MFRSQAIFFYGRADFTCFADHLVRACKGLKFMALKIVCKIYFHIAIDDEECFADHFLDLSVVTQF